MIFFYGITNSIFMVILVFNRDRRIYFVKNNLKSILAVLISRLKKGGVSHSRKMRQVLIQCHNPEIYEQKNGVSCNYIFTLTAQLISIPGNKIPIVLTAKESNVYQMKQT
jgi:hypothetical protein